MDKAPKDPEHGPQFHMNRDFYLALAAEGLRMPIGTHLLLHEHSDPDKILLDGTRLGRVVRDTAQRFRTPLAIPLMDLTLEKSALLAGLGIAGPEAESHHFDQPLPAGLQTPLSPRMRAGCEAIQYVAKTTALLPIGMAIGPFSLATKLLADPITPVFLAGTGAGAADEKEVHVLESVLQAALQVVLAYASAQLDAGAKAILICEPAANKVYFSPNQLARSFAIFDRFVIEPNRQIKQLLESRGVDLIFHDCGELLDSMITRFCDLDPAILSLGSSRKLWEDAARVSPSTVLYGNLPTKRFYSDALITVPEVERLAAELASNMRRVGHPFIMGSECDVLSVPGCEATISRKVDAFLRVAAKHL